MLLEKGVMPALGSSTAGGAGSSGLFINTLASGSRRGAGGNSGGGTGLGAGGSWD